MSECRGFELKTGLFRESKQQIHVVDGSTGGTFEQIIDCDCYEKFVGTVTVKMYETFVGVDYILEIDGSL